MTTFSIKTNSGTQLSHSTTTGIMNDAIKVQSVSWYKTSR